MAKIRARSKSPAAKKKKSRSKSRSKSTSSGSSSDKVTALVNAIMALPFALRILVGPTRDVVQGYGRLSLSLGLTGRQWLRIIYLPRMRAPLGFACGLTAALSMGDLGVIALFADPETATLPLQMYRLMGSYRMEAASGAALLLLVLSFGLFWLFDRGGRGHADS